MSFYVYCYYIYQVIHNTSTYGVKYNWATLYIIVGCQPIILGKVVQLVPP